MALDAQKEVVRQLIRTKAGDAVLRLLQLRRADVEKRWTRCVKADDMRRQQGRAAELDDLIKLLDPSPQRQGE